MAKTLNIQLDSVHEGCVLKPGIAFPAFTGKVLIGRNPSVDLVLADVSVSGHHAEIEATDTGFVVRNLSRRGTTFVEGERLAPSTEKHILNTVFWLQVGRALLKVTGHETTIPVSRMLPLPTPNMAPRPQPVSPPSTEPPMLSLRRGPALRVLLEGTRVTIFPSAARALIRLCETPGCVVEQDDLLKNIDADYRHKSGGNNLNQVITYIRQMFLSALKEGALTSPRLVEQIRRCEDFEEQSPLEDMNDKALTRVLITNIRGVGYQLMLPDDMISIKD